MGSKAPVTTPRDAEEDAIQLGADRPASPKPLSPEEFARLEEVLAEEPRQPTEWMREAVENYRRLLGDPGR